MKRLKPYGVSLVWFFPKKYDDLCQTPAIEILANQCTCELSWGFVKVIVSVLTSTVLSSARVLLSARVLFWQRDSECRIIIRSTDSPNLAKHFQPLDLFFFQEIARNCSCVSPVVHRHPLFWVQYLSNSAKVNRSEYYIYEEKKEEETLHLQLEIPPTHLDQPPQLSPSPVPLTTPWSTINTSPSEQITALQFNAFLIGWFPVKSSINLQRHKQTPTTPIPSQH